MSIRPLFAVAAVAVIGAACAPTSGPMPYGPAPSTAFNAEAFAWSAGTGQAVINGRVNYRQDGQAYDCTGSVALTPDTPYTRNRFSILYGSIDRAAVPEAVVRARTVSDPNADYRSFVRSATCNEGRFSFTGLPDGGWFVIAPVSAGGERVVLMRRVETRGGRTVNITL
jgi:hypothetical protein